MVGVVDAKLEVTSRCQAPLVPLYHVHLSAGCVVKPTNGQGYGTACLDATLRCLVAIRRFARSTSRDTAAAQQTPIPASSFIFRTPPHPRSLFVLLQFLNPPSICCSVYSLDQFSQGPIPTSPHTSINESHHETIHSTVTPPDYPSSLTSESARRNG